MNGFFTWLRHFVDDVAGSLSRAEILVILALARHADRNGESWPSAQRLGEICGLSVPTVYRALDRLRDRALVTWQTRLRRGRYRAYEVRVYRFAGFTEPPAATEAHSQRREHALTGRMMFSFGATRN